MIRKYVQELLRDNPDDYARWATLITGAATQARLHKILAHQRPGIRFFAAMGDLAGANSALRISVRCRGHQVGTLTQESGETPLFILTKPAKEASTLTPVFRALRTEVGEKCWMAVETGCAWNSKFASKVLGRLGRMEIGKKPKELAIEESLVTSLRHKHFWFDRCALVQFEEGQSFPFKFNAPVVVMQKKDVPPTIPEMLKLIQPPKSYGGADILARVQTVMGGGAERLGVFELKRPGGKASYALFQAYAYAVAFDEAQNRPCEKAPKLRESLRRLLGHPNPTPRRIRFAAYAVVAERDVPRVLDSQLTSEVLKEAGDAMLLGILGYQLEKGILKLTSAVRREGKGWKDILPAARRTEITMQAA